MALITVKVSVDDEVRRLLERQANSAERTEIRLSDIAERVDSLVLHTAGCLDALEQIEHRLDEARVALERIAKVLEPEPRRPAGFVLNVGEPREE